jgi:hypothetical protein
MNALGAHHQEAWPAISANFFDDQHSGKEIGGSATQLLWHAQHADSVFSESVHELDRISAFLIALLKVFLGKISRHKFMNAGK